MKRVWIVLAVILLCVAVVFAGYIGWRFLQREEKPIAVILSPERTVMLDSGEGIAIIVDAQADAGVARIVLLVDGEVYAEGSASGENTLTLAFPWYATSLGSHTLEALVYDSMNQVSEPASLLVGVQANIEPDRMDFVYIPPAEGGDEGDGSGGGAGRIVPMDDSVQPQNNILPAPIDGSNSQEIILGEPISPDEVLAMPDAQDSVPIISAFEASPQRNGQQVQIAYHVDAQDDLGINRLEFLVEQINGEEYTRTMLCFDETPCVVDDVFPLAGTGTWHMSVIAVDTSGQASTRQLLLIEIMDGGEFAPAIALQQVDGEHPLVLSPRDEVPLITSLDWTTLLVDGSPENPVTAENNCMRALVEPRAQGNFVSMVYVCSENAPPNYHLGWRISVVPSLLGGEKEKLVDRRIEDLVSLNYGQNFSYLHETPLCGTLSSYRIELDWLPNADANGGRLNSSESIGVIEVMNVPGPPCGADGLIQDLQALAVPEGAQVSWKFLQDASVTEALHYWLYRDNLEDILEAEIVEEGFLEEGALAAGDVLHNSTDTGNRCGFGAYDYFVVARHSTPEQVAFASTTFDRTPCPSDSLENITIELIPGYSLLDVDNSVPPETVKPTVTVKSFILPSPSWAGYEYLTLHLNIDSPDLPDNERGERIPLRGNPTSIHITDEIVANGFSFESAVWARCGGLRWNVSWELLLGGEPIESGPVFTVRTAPCLPPREAAPVITSITSSSDCVTGYASCAILTWELSDHPAPTDPTVELPMTGFAVYRYTNFYFGRLDALGGDPAEMTKASLIYVGAGKTQLEMWVPCIPDEAFLIYSYTIVPMAWTEETHSLYSNAGTTTARMDACKGLPYDAIGTIQR